MAALDTRDKDFLKYDSIAHYNLDVKSLQMELKLFGKSIKNSKKCYKNTLDVLILIDAFPELFKILLISVVCHHQALDASEPSVYYVKLKTILKKQYGR